MIPFSILDLAPIAEGSDAGRALRNARSLAQAGERPGYDRFWMAGHHRKSASARTGPDTLQHDRLANRIS